VGGEGGGEGHSSVGLLARTAKQITLLEPNMEKVNQSLY